jgi:AbrB family looped-hinge helix DNA binding protein
MQTCRAGEVGQQVVLARRSLSMPTAKVQARGQITLPQKIREKAGIKPGDELWVHVTPSGTIEMKVLPSLTVDELVALYPIEGPIDDKADRDAWEDEVLNDVSER